MRKRKNEMATGIGGTVWTVRESLRYLEGRMRPVKVWRACRARILGVKKRKGYSCIVAIGAMPGKQEQEIQYIRLDQLGVTAFTSRQEAERIAMERQKRYAEAEDLRDVRAMRSMYHW